MHLILPIHLLILRLVLLHALDDGGLGALLEVRAHVAGEVVLEIVLLLVTRLLVVLGLHAQLPLGPHLLHLHLVVEFGVVVLAHAAEALPQRQVLGVDGHAVVVVLAARADVVPAALLLLEVQARGVGEEDHGQEHADQTEPGDDVEAGLRIGDVGEHDGRGQGAELATGGAKKKGCEFSFRSEVERERDEEMGSLRETVSRGTDGCWVTFGGHDERDTVGAELVEVR